MNTTEADDEPDDGAPSDDPDERSADRASQCMTTARGRQS